MFIFDNAGKKFGSIIKVAYIFFMVICIIAGLIYGIKLESFGVFVVLSVIAPFVIWLSALFIIGFLDMMADVHEIRDTVLSGTNGMKSVSSSVNVQPVMKDESEWVCSKCKRSNTKQSVYCKHCGEKRNQW